jgi:hypothetical protein
MRSRESVGEDQVRVRGSKSGASDDQLTDAGIVAASGPKVFDRGRTYAASGAVRVTEELRGVDMRIRGEIDGTQTYETEVWLEDGAIGGSCDCPHAADGRFCKHLVALCLVWRDRLAGTTTVVDETARRKVQAAARAAQTRRDRRDALHEFLRAQPASALAERLIDLADQFTDIERVLRMWQKAAAAPAAPKELRTLVTEALTVRSPFLPLNQVRGWVLQAEPILPLLRDARECDARSAADISLHALRRGWAAMQKADDSNGEIGGLCRAIADEWVACLRATGEQPAGFGDTWLRIRLEDPFGCVEEQAVEEIMGSAALARYRRLLAAEWDKARGMASDSRAPGRRSPRTRILGQADYHLRAIERLHVGQLEKIGDLDGALAVLRSDLAAPDRYLQVTRFLEVHGRLREAFASAEVAWRRFPDDWRIQEDLLRMYERDGWLAEAHSLRRSQFEAAPNVERYGRALQSGVVAGCDRDALRAELFSFMEQIEEDVMRAPSPRFARPREREVAALRNVSLRGQVLVEEGRVYEALALVQMPSVCHPLVLRQIALKLGEDRYGAAVTLLQRVFVHAMRTAQTPYRDELELVRQIQTRQDAESRAAWLAQLRVEFKAKRNFIRGLPS